MAVVPNTRYSVNPYHFPGSGGTYGGGGGIVVNPGTGPGRGVNPYSYLNLGLAGGLPGGGGYGALQSQYDPRKRLLRGAAPRPGGKPNDAYLNQPGPVGNVYKDQPGFDPLNIKGEGDYGFRYNRLRGGTTNQLNQLSNAALHFRGMTPPLPQGGGAGYGDTGMGAIKKLILARLGGI